MNGKKAKLLRRAAKQMCEKMGKKPRERFNEYDQVNNCIRMEPAYDDSGKRRLDPEGYPLTVPRFVPGTVRSGWHVRVIYQWLKRRYKNGAFKIAS